MEEKLTAKREKPIITKRVMLIIAILSGDFFIFFSIFNPADKIKNTIYDLSNETKKLTLSQKLKLQLSKGLQPITDALQASSNISAIKDSLFHKILKKFHLETAIKKAVLKRLFLLSCFSTNF